MNLIQLVLIAAGLMTFMTLMFSALSGPSPAKASARRLQAGGELLRLRIELRISQGPIRADDRGAITEAVSRVLENVADQHDE